MIGHEDVLMRPVMRGLLRFESLTDGTVSLSDVMLLNEAIDVEQENNRRAYAYERQQRANRR